MKNDVLYIVMPAYNEEANIEDVVVQWYKILIKINKQKRGGKIQIVNCQ